MIIDRVTAERGCDHCHGHIMVKIASPAGMIELCWDHALKFAGVDSTWMEEHHSPFLDHLLEAFKRDKARYEAWLAQQGSPA